MLRPLKRDVVGDLGKVLWVLMGSIGVVLLIACANVANLLLVRAEGRQQELAIRAALGAGSAQIAREFLMESVFLGLAGGVAGLGVAYAALRCLVGDRASLFPVSIISRSIRWCCCSHWSFPRAGVLFGLIPAIKYAGASVTGTLRAGGRVAQPEPGDASRAEHAGGGAMALAVVC